MEIKTERLILREFSEKDYDFFYNLKNNEYIHEFEADEIPSKEEITKKFSQILESKNKNPRKYYDFIFVKKNEGVPMGRVLIWEIDDNIKEWEIGWEIHPDFAGKGYSTEASKALVEFAFKELKIHRLQALCNDKNIRSENIMKKIGMKKEGVIRAVRYLNKKWDGSLIYSIIDTDYKENN